MVKIMDWIRSIPTGGSTLQEGPNSDDERQSSSRKSSPNGNSSGSSDLEMPCACNSTAASRDNSIEPNSSKPPSLLLINENGEAKKQTFSIAERPFPDLDPLAFNDEDEIYIESQPWHDGQTGPLTHEEFLTFKKLINEDYKNIRLDKLEMLKRTDEERNDLRSKVKQAELAKERLVQKMEAEKDKLKADMADMQKELDQYKDLINEPNLQATVSLLENSTPAQIKKLKDLLENNPEQIKQLEELHDKEVANRQKRRGPLREPVFTSDYIYNDRAIPPFLYDNPADNAIELQICKLLLATEKILRTKDHSKENLDQADKHTLSAYEESTKLNHEPMEARCAFWKGRVAYAAKNYDGAEFAFRASRSAFGQYFEGLHCEDWIDASRAKKKRRAKILKERQANGILDDAPWLESEAEEESKDIDMPDVLEKEEEEEKPTRRPKPKAGHTLPNPNRSSILVKGKGRPPDFGLSGLAGVLGISLEDSVASMKSDSIDSSSKGLDDVQEDNSSQSGSARWQTVNVSPTSDTSSPVGTHLASGSPGSSRSGGSGRTRRSVRRARRGRKVTLANELEDTEMGEGRGLE